MKNRMTHYLSASRHTGQTSKAAIPESRQLSHGQSVLRTQDVESYVTEHPLVAIGAAFSIGVFLAWMIKRN